MSDPIEFSALIQAVGNFAGAVLVSGTLLLAVIKWIKKPSDELKKQLDAFGEQMSKQQELDKIICKSLLIGLDVADGKPANGEVKECKKALQDYLIGK